MKEPFPYWKQVDQIKALRRQGREDEAIHLLMVCVFAISLDRTGAPAPWYFEQLAIIYRKRKDYAAEVEIIDDYERMLKSALARHQGLRMPSKWMDLKVRRSKARDLLAKQQSDGQ